MFVNGQEMNDSQYQEALAEVAGMNDGKEFSKAAEMAKGMKDQVFLQGARSATMGAISLPGNIYRNGKQANASLLSQMLSMLLGTISRASQSIGR